MRIFFPFQTSLFVVALACTGGSRSSEGPASIFATADSLRRLEQYQSALSRYAHLRDSLATTGDSAGWWKAELWWAYSQARTGNIDSAVQTMSRVRSLTGTDPERRAWTHAVASNILSLQGHFDSALVEVQSARRLVGGSSDVELQHTVSYAMGWVYASLGRQQEAFSADSEAVARLRALENPPRHLLASALHGLGTDYYWQGRYTEAARDMEEALAIYRKLGQRQGAIRTMVALGDVYVRHSNPERALEIYTEALADAEHIGGRTNEVGILHNNLALVYLDHRNWPAARRHLERALEIGRSTGQPYAEVLALYNQGRLELLTGNPQAGRGTLLAALRLADSLGFTNHSSGALVELVYAFADLGEPATALGWADSALTTARTLGTPRLVVAALEARGMALELAGRLSEAIATNLEALGIIDSWRGKVALGSQRTGMGHDFFYIYERTIRSLFRQGRKAEAFDVAERARARLLLDLMADREGADSTVPPGRQAGLTSSPVSAAQVQRGLVGDSGSLLEFFWGQDFVYGWWITPENVHAARLGPADSLSALLEFLGSSISSSRSDTTWRAAAHRAYQVLVAPLEPTLDEQTLVVTDGPLARVPLEVLLPEKSGRPWGVERRVIYGPSASVLLALDRASRPAHWKQAVLAVGNPSVGKGRVADSLRAANDPLPGPLPYAEREARAIGDLFEPQGARALLGRKATLSRWLEQDPAGFRYLHFATHARINDRRPERTHLVLSQSLLTLPEIHSLRLNAELVTLSACETALGRRVRGEGVIGLPHAFLAAGARGVLVTLWRIEDHSAADFMREFYQELHRGQPPGEALRIVRSRWTARPGAAAHPSRWAPFVLVGGV